MHEGELGACYCLSPVCPLICYHGIEKPLQFSHHFY